MISSRTYEEVIARRKCGEGATCCIEMVASTCRLMQDQLQGAVAKTLGHGAVGVVCRSSEGDYLGASAVVFIGVTDPGCLEALACRESLALSVDLNIGPIMVASDCMEFCKSYRRSGWVVLVQSSARSKLWRGNGVSSHQGRI
jgi:hypothetical protein